MTKRKGYLYNPIRNRHRRYPGLESCQGEEGMVMVQDVKSAAYDGMPGSAIATGLADYVLPPEKMPQQLLKYVKQFSFKGQENR